LYLRDGQGKANFTKRPHLTLGINRDAVGASLAIPNGVPPTMRRSLAALEVDGLTRVHREILARTRALRSHGATVAAYAIQRHWLKRGSPEIVDARLKFNLATAIKGVDSRVKEQAAWSGTLAAILADKRGNVQIGYSVEWPHGTSNALWSQAALDRIVEGWC